MKKKIFIFIFIVIIIIGGIYFLNFKKHKNISNKINISQTIQILKDNNLYQEKYKKDYEKIEYVENENFMNYINLYLEKGYNSNEVNTIFKLSQKNQNKILKKEKIDFLKYAKIKNFNVDNIDRYNEYLNKFNIDIDKCVTYVNINLDKKVYEDSKIINNPNDITVIVNKFNHLPKDFVPKNLTKLFDNSNASLIEEAAILYKELINKAKEDGIILTSTTAYRSYSFQNILYSKYVKEDGEEIANTYSAKPGSSEHQLGLAVDLNDPTITDKRLDDKDYEWLKNNSYKFGFIIRYTKEGEKITGYMEENWHIRYLGVELATNVAKSNLTYEEYYDLYIQEY